MSSLENIKVPKVVEFPKRNPLLIPEVLENTLNQSKWSFEDLKSMRSVCKLWRDYTISRWRSTATVCLLQERRPSSRRQGILANKFVEHLCDDSDPFQLKSIPFRKYKLFNWRFDGRNENFIGTWNSFGDLIERLTLERCIFDGKESMYFNYMVYIGSPELKHLVLDSCENVNDWIGLRTSTSTACNPKMERLEVTKWMPFKQPGADSYEYQEFLRSFPCLKALKMSEMEKEFLMDNLSETILDDAKEVSKNNFLLRRTLKPGYIPQLQELDIMHWNMSPHSEASTTGPLAEFQFPLLSLSVSLNGCSSVGDQFTRILTSHRKTLQVLKVFVAPHLPIQIYPLEDCEDFLIEDLEFWGNVLNDLSFLMKMPKLRRLKMDFGCFEKWKFMDKAYSEKAVFPVTAQDIMEVTFGYDDGIKPTDFVVLEHLTEFHIDLKFGEEEIKPFAKWMPNLKIFRSVFDNNNFRCILHEWRNMKLRELHALFGSELDDFAICGYPKDKKCRDITWLKDLRHFSSDAYCNMGRFTDKSARNGFLKTNLCSLKISVSPEFSQEMEEKLKLSIAQVEVVRNYGNHTGECCRRLLFKKKALVPKESGVDKRAYHKLRREDLTEAGSVM